VRAIGTLAALDATPFTLVFGGGTALARAHKLIRRMSEDVDFKIVPTPAAPVTRSGLHRQRSVLRDRVTGALQAAGFAFDPKDPAQVRSRDESGYVVFQLPYTASGGGEELRPTIQIELKYTTLRLPRLRLPVSSFVAEALNRPPEVPAIACVDVTETAAEKLVSLTRRTAMDLAGLTRDFDPALVRHVYDLHMLQGTSTAARSSPWPATSPRSMPLSSAISIPPTMPTSPARPSRRSMPCVRTRCTASATTASSPPRSTASGWNSMRPWARSADWLATRGEGSPVDLHRGDTPEGSEARPSRPISLPLGTVRVASVEINRNAIK
jgi:hypothetical protein